MQSFRVIQFDCIIGYFFGLNHASKGLVAINFDRKIAFYTLCKGVFVAMVLFGMLISIIFLSKSECKSNIRLVFPCWNYSLVKYCS